MHSPDCSVAHHEADHNVPIYVDLRDDASFLAALKRIIYVRSKYKY